VSHAVNQSTKGDDSSFGPRLSSEQGGQLHLPCITWPLSTPARRLESTDRVVSASPATLEETTAPCVKPTAGCR